MVLQLQSKHSKLAAGLSGLREGLAQGFGMGQTARRTQLAERDQAAQEEYYRNARADAERRLALQEQQGARAAEEFDIAKKQRAQFEEGSQAISQYALDTQGRDEDNVVGAGQGPFADLQAYQATKLGRQKEILKQLPPELHKRHLDTIRAEMEDEQNQALLEHNQTRLEKLSASPMHSEGGELGHVGEARAARIEELKEIASNAKTPEARAEAVRLIGDAVQKQIMADAVEADRLRTVARTAQAAQQDMATMEQVVAQNRAAGVAPEVLADMEASLGAMGTTLAFYEAANGEMTPQQFSQAWQMARRARAPRPAAGRGAGSGGGAAPGSEDPKALDRDARIREKAAERADAKFEAQTGEGADRLPWESIFAREYQMLGGKGDRAPEQSAATPTPEEVEPGGALDKTMFNADSFKTQIQELLDGGDGRKARELFKKAKLGTQFDQTSTPGGEGIPTDTKTLMRNRTRGGSK